MELTVARRRAAALAAGLLLHGCGGGDDPVAPLNAPGPAGPAGEWSIADLVPRASRVPEELFPQAGNDRTYRFDADCMILLQPDHREVWPWPEHAGGEVTIQTNDLGLLECEPTRTEKSLPRTLVAGDSHMMVVDCDESFPNVLEARMGVEGQACEFLVSGVGYTSPALYLQRLLRFLYLEPDVFVFTVFTGNDFLDQLVLDFDVPRSPKPIGEAYYERLERCREGYAKALYQGLNQAHFFAHWPGAEDLARERVLGVVEETAAVCAREGIAFVVLLLPTKFDLDDDDEEGFAGALAALELPREALGASRRVALGLAGALAERGIACLDPLEAMRAAGEPCFWKKDYHLSTTGHALVADALHDTLVSLLADGPRRPR